MLKNSINPQDVCDLLNELLKLDYHCVKTLVSHRVRCNEAIAGHPTVQVQKFIDDEHPKVGLIGILNGLFGIREDGVGAICCETNESGKIIKFKITPEQPII